MRLPNPHRTVVFMQACQSLTEGQIIAAIMERRELVRTHRDQLGDHRCWLDDPPMWLMLDDTPPEPPRLPPEPEMMGVCELFFLHRNADAPDIIPANAILDRALWDQDLENKSKAQLIEPLWKIQMAICLHRDMPIQQNRPRNIEDDRALYKALPEKLPADFRLPPREEFLGRAKAPHAGCPAFHDSHNQCPAICPACDLHNWGPCRPKTVSAS